MIVDRQTQTERDIQTHSSQYSAPLSGVEKQVVRTQCASVTKLCNFAPSYRYSVSTCKYTHKQAQACWRIMQHYLTISNGPYTHTLFCASNTFLVCLLAQRRNAQRMCELLLTLLLLLLLLILLLLLLDPFNGFFSRTTWVSRYQKGKTSLDLNEPRDDWVLDGSGISWMICKRSAPRSRQAATPTHVTQFLQARCSF